MRRAHVCDNGSLFKLFISPDLSSPVGCFVTAIPLVPLPQGGFGIPMPPPMPFFLPPWSPMRQFLQPPFSCLAQAQVPMNRPMLMQRMASPVVADDANLAGHGKNTGEVAEPEPEAITSRCRSVPNLARSDLEPSPVESESASEVLEKAKRRILRLLRQIYPNSIADRDLSSAYKAFYGADFDPKTALNVNWMEFVLRFLTGQCDLELAPVDGGGWRVKLNRETFEEGEADETKSFSEKTGSLSSVSPTLQPSVSAVSDISEK